MALAWGCTILTMLLSAVECEWRRLGPISPRFDKRTSLKWGKANGRSECTNDRPIYEPRNPPLDLLHYRNRPHASYDVGVPRAGGSQHSSLWMAEASRSSRTSSFTAPR